MPGDIRQAAEQDTKKDVLEGHYRRLVRKVASEAISRCNPTQSDTKPHNGFFGGDWRGKRQARCRLSSHLMRVLHYRNMPTLRITACF
jgi:hypothetical protein